MDGLYLVKVPVAFFVRTTDEHKITTAYCIMDEMTQGADDFVYFGEPAIEQVF